MYTQNDYNSFTPGGPGGISIKGAWINKQTGQEIMVRDNIITDNGMQIITNIGMIPMNEFSRDYIQASEEEYDLQGNVINSGNGPSSNDNPLPPMNDNPLNQTFIPKEDYQTEAYNNQFNEEKLNKELNAIQPQPQPQPQPQSNYDLIGKLFNKLSTKPEIELNIKWADFPKQELQTLINYLDVSEKDIASYIYEQYADADAIKFEIFNYLSNVLNLEA